MIGLRLDAIAARTSSILRADGRRRQPVAGKIHRHVVDRVGNDRVLNVLGNVDQHRPGPARPRQMKRFPHDPGDVLGVLDQVMVLGDRARHLHHRRFLERVGADHVPRNLAGHGDQRHGIHLGVGQPGHQVERPGARGRHDDARLAGRPGVALGREDAPLLVARQDRADAVAVPRQRLVHRHARPARIGEDDVDIVAHERLDQHVRSRKRPRCGFGHGPAIVDGGHGESSLPEKYKRNGRAQPRAVSRCAR